MRRVGFRNGTVDELTALHAVESPIEAERRPDRVPQPVDSYIAFARSLPSQFQDHTWLAEDEDGVPMAAAACWTNAAGDERVMECDLFVRRDRRREGIGTRLLAEICEVCIEGGQTRLVWSTFDTVDAGEAMSARLGAAVALVNRLSELRVDRLDWEMVDRWVAEGPVRAPGYSIEFVDGPFRPAQYDDAVRLHHIMQTAPRDDLDVGDVLVGPNDIAEEDRALADAGRDRWTLFVRNPDGECVGGTQVLFEPWEPATVLQDNTGIDPGDRGLGLGKWAKGAMLQRIRAERPDAARVRTGNAYSNVPMLAINDALGFEVISTKTEWQAAVEDVRRRVVVAGWLSAPWPERPQSERF